MTETIEVTVSSDAQRKASAVYFKKREQAGLKRATFWLTPTVLDVTIFCGGTGEKRTRTR